MEVDDERVRATPWPGAPDGSAYDTNVELLVHNSSSDTESPPSTSEITLLGHQIGPQTGSFNSIVLKQQLALQWMDRQKQCYQFLPVAVEDEPDWDHLQNKINLGPHGTRQVKAAKDSKGKKGGSICTVLNITSD